MSSATLPLALSDVVGVAIVGAVTTVVTAIVTYRVSRNNNATELAKVEAENERLREQHHEDRRRSREDTYVRLVAGIHALVSVSPTEPHFHEAMHGWRLALAAAQVFASPELDAALFELSAHTSDLPSKEDEEKFAAWRAELEDRGTAVLRLAQQDVGSGAPPDERRFHPDRAG